MTLLRLQNISLAYGDLPLLDQVNLTIEPGERLCLVGRNGTGKSTLMKVIIGEAIPEEGAIERGETRIARLQQEVPQEATGTVYDIAAEGVGEIGKLIAHYHHLALQTATDSSEKLLEELAHAQHQLDACNGWNLQQQIETVLSKMALDPEAEFSTLSGGMKRRVLLAQALVQQPDLLLLDEPTNHLDIESIQWLEEFLLGANLTLLFITHDRAFLRRLATRIIELDRGILTSWPGNYDTYLEKKAQALEEEERANALFDKKLAQEEVWIRQGIKARRTRNEGRVRALKALREERSQRRNRTGNAKMTAQQAESSGKIVVEATQISYVYDGEPLIRDFSTTIERGDRIGIIGPNGCGKSTLLKLLLGKLKPDSGKLKQGTNLEIAYFDQLRETLKEDQSVQDNLAEGRERIMVNGNPKHVIGYLQDFLFSPQRTRSPVSTLSGGERNRLLLAKLFSKPANILVLDEPTNDLDVETLELLEELLLDYKGTLLLVSHDRAFLNNVVTGTIVFEGNGKLEEYVGGYDDWIRQRKPAFDEVSTAKNLEKQKKPEEKSGKSAKTTKKAEKNTDNSKNPAKKKLSYKEKLELEKLPKQIEEMEEEQTALQEKLADPEFFQNATPDEMKETTEKLAALEPLLSAAYDRWEVLEEQV